MQAAATISLAALMAGPVTADSSFVELAGCALHPIATEGGCTAAEAASALDGLEPEWGYRVSASADTEAYAIVSVLGELQKGFAAWTRGDCDAAELSAYAADEIWTWYVKMGPDANEQGAIDFAAIETFKTHAIGFLSDPPAGACP